MIIIINRVKTICLQTSLGILEDKNNTQSKNNTSSNFHRDLKIRNKAKNIFSPLWLGNLISIYRRVL